MNIPANQLSSHKSVIGAHVKPLFIDYYESNIDKIKSAHGSDNSNWPKIWDFGRVIRNTFSHGGEIFISNPQANPVAWKSLSYSNTDNGRQVLFNDLGIADVILLLEEMDDEI